MCWRQGAPPHPLPRCRSSLRRCGVSLHRERLNTPAACLKVTLQASGADLPPKPCGGSQFYAVLADACGCSGIHFDLKSAIKAKTPQGLANSSGHEGITVCPCQSGRRVHPRGCPLLFPLTVPLAAVIREV